MAKQLNVNLAFNADTSKAKQQIQDLQNQLSAIINMPSSSFANGITPKIQEATKAVAELKVHLQNATNVKTGNLDFTKLNQSIKNSGSSLSEYATKLQSLGPTGEKAFTLLAQSVASAEVPIRRSNALLSELWVTMKNTVRWQLTSSTLHGFIGAVQSAVGYTKDLNESLNNIRIVTGHSVEQMADFAKEANKAAKSLSTSTLNYTDAALIYYQQGLDDTQVKERTDITIKMANVSRQSAEEVSDQMTAVWNNFAKGSESLEHFADVMTRLGADTASSSDEIAQGLEKFAAIANMIGLSFDNAAAALATVTATTRQSADVVGTAFKTIFARIQGLSLGETLDDGTNLNKYSKALNAVGINIKEQNGELKGMDSILEEMGAKWKTLSKDQQVALAQTVAGVRQYNQLIALMDNFDFYQKNLNAAQNSDGSLQEQADIYEESWEAASKRVKASLEGLYNSLINDKAFIDILNAIEKIVNGIEILVDSIGGFGGVITTFGVIFTNVFRKQISESLSNASYSLMSWTEAGRQKIQQEKMEQFSQMLQNAQIGKTEREVLEAQFKNYQKLTDSAKDLTDFERQTLQILLDQQKARGDLAIKKREEADQAEAQANEARIDAKWAVRNAYGKTKKLSISTGDGTKKDVTPDEAFEEYNKALDRMMNARSQYLNAPPGEDKQKLEEVYYEEANAVKELEKVLKKAREALITYKRAEEEAFGKNKQADAALEDATRSAEEETQKTKENSDAKQQNAQATGKATKEEQEFQQGQQKSGQAIDQVNDKLDKQNQKKNKLNSTQISQNFVASANVAMSAASAIQSISSAMDILTSDADPLQKITSSIISFSMAAGMGINTLKGLDKITLSSGKSLGQAAASTGLATKVLNKFGVTATKAGSAAAGSAIALGSLALYATAAVAAIAAVVAIVKISIDIYNKDADAAKEAAQAADALAESSSKLRQEFEDLQSTFENYDLLLENLKSAKEGTDEWREALEKVNDETLNIIEKYPDLLKMENVFDNYGKINKEAIDTYIKTAGDKADNARLASISASASASQKKVVSDTTNLSREISNYVDGFLSTTKTYAESGGVIASARDEKELINKLVNTFNNKIENGIITENADDFNNIINEYTESLGLSEFEQSQLTGQLEKYRGDVIELANATKNATIQMENVAKISAQQILGENASEDQIDEWSNVFNTAKEEYQGGEGITRFTGKNDQVLLNLLEDAGITTGLSNNAVYNDNGVLKVRFEDGTEQTLYEIKELAASNVAREQANTEVVNPIFESFSNEGIQLNEGISTDLVVSLMGQVEINQALIDAFQKTGNSVVEQEKLIKDILNSQTEEEKEASKYELDPDLIEEQTKQLMSLYKSEGLTEKEATKLAIENSRMNKGVKDLIDNWEDWNKELKAGQLDKSKKGTVQYAQTIKDLTKTIANLTGASEDLELPSEFFDSEDNLKLIGQAAKGSESAINELGVAVAKTSIELMKQNDWIIEFTNGEKQIINNSDFESAKQTVLSGLDELQTKLKENQNLVGQGLDAILNGGTEGANAWIQSMNEMALATGMSVEEMNSMLNEMGLEADLTITEKNVTSSKPITRTEMSNIDVDEETGQLKSYDMTTRIVGYTPVEEVIQVPQIATNGENPGEPSVKYIGNGSVSPTGSVKKDGGSSSKASKVSMTKKSDVVDRYKEINDQLDDINDELSRTNKLTDRLFGAQRLSQMDKEISILNKQSEALKKKRKEAENYLKVDKQAVLDLNKTYGTQFKIDDSGLISNYEDELSKLYNDLHAAEQKSQSYYTSGASKDVQDKFNQSTLEPIKEKISIIKEVLSQYDETRELFEDLNDQVQDVNNQIQDLNYEKIQYKLELKIGIEDAELKRLDYFLNKFSDDFYKMAESAVLMMNKIGPTSNILDTYKANVNELNKAYQNGDISQADYIEGLKNTRDAIYEQLEALNELDKQMLHYYEDTLSAATDELSDYTDHMEHLTSVFEHYQNLLSIIGKSKDYEAMGNFLQGQADTIKDRLSVAQSYYNVLLQQKDEIQAELQAAIASGDEAMIEMYQKEWDAIVDETDAAQEQVLSLTEEWAEAMKSVIQNNMEKIADTLEKTLAGGTTFDTLMDGFDKLNTRQEEYLTKTNQIYETNKLMRTASKALDETDNKVAKQKLKNFIDETKGLQETTQLSKYELEIQQAKYDLLLAQIALEEAQNAKSTVRLSRDNEGNFGYVYTADQNKIDDAQQAVGDADNKLYNLSLEGQQQYTEKYLQAEQAMYEELKQLQQDYLDGNIASEEEYELRKSQIQDHYLGPEGVLTTYSKLYNVAVQTDANATADYWGKEYGRMTQDTEAWKIAVNDYLLEVDEQIEDWKEVQNQANKEAQGALNNSEKATKELTDESKKLRDTLKNKVIPAIGEEIDTVREQTDAYVNQRQELLDLIATYERYLALLNKQIAGASGGDIDFSFEAAKAFVSGDSEGVLSNLGSRGDKAVVGVNTSVSNERLTNLFDAASGDSSYTKKQQEDAKNLINKVAEGNDNKFTDKTLSAIGFKTGGYTGSWGPEGKLAILHEKELILNQDDTQNILSTVSLIRELVNMIDAQAASASLFNLISTPSPNPNTNTLEQRVEITAEFPNVNDRYEIEEAFNNLVNRASQYANKAF